MKEKELINQTLKRIHVNLIDYINFIVKRYKEEYEVKITFTEASNILAKRAKSETLFK